MEAEKLYWKISQEIEKSIQMNKGSQFAFFGSGNLGIQKAIDWADLIINL